MSISRLSASLLDAAVCALPAAIPFWYPMDAAWRILPSTSPRTSRGSHVRDRSDPDASLTWGVRNLADLLDVSTHFLHEGCLTVFAVVESVRPEREAREVEREAGQRVYQEPDA